MVGEAPRRERTGRWIRTVGVSIASIPVGLVIAELILRLVAAASPDVDRLLSPPVPPVIGDDRLGWRGNPAYRDHDAAGFRNRARPRAAEIVALGDSQTYGFKVARERAWPQQLAGLTGRATYNMAFPGWGPVHSWLVLDEALALRPRTLIEAVYTGNDLVDAYTLAFGRRAAADVRSADPSVLEALASAEREVPWAGNADIGSVRPEGAWAPASSVTLAGRDVRLLGLWYAVGRALEPDDTDATVGERVAFAAGGLRTTFLPRRRLAAMDRGDVRVVEGARLVLEAVARMNDRAAATGARLVVLIIPTKEFAFADAVARAGAVQDATYLRLVAQEGEILRDLRVGLAALDVPVVEATGALRALIADGRNPYLETENGHPNAVGQRAIAEAVGAWVRSQPR